MVLAREVIAQGLIAMGVLGRVPENPERRLLRVLALVMVPVTAGLAHAVDAELAVAVWADARQDVGMAR